MYGFGLVMVPIVSQFSCGQILIENALHSYGSINIDIGINFFLLIFRIMGNSLVGSNILTQF